MGSELDNDMAAIAASRAREASGAVATFGDWIPRDEARELPALVRALVQHREGWQPARWAQHLLERAERIRDREIAESFRMAARLIQERKR